ncbi:MAG: hypothetical protein ACLUUL_10465 [Gemmiger sp.]
MKLKKLVSAVVCAAMACVFAVSAFAADPDTIAARRKDAVDYLNGRGLTSLASAVGQLDDTVIDNVIESNWTRSSLEYTLNNYAEQIEAAGTDTAEIARLLRSAAADVSSFGINIAITGVNFDSNGNLVVDATLNGIAVNETVALTTSTSGSTTTDEHPDIAANKDENGNWHVDEATTAAASSVTTTAGGVIKATGDNSAVVLVAGVLVVAAVLGLAVRKNSNVG